MTAVVETFKVDPVRPSRYSMSFIRSAGECLRRAHHDREGDSSGTDAIIGRVFHEVAAAIGWSCVMRGQATPDYVEAERIARRVMSQPEELNPLSKHVWDEVLSLLGRWVVKAEFRPGEEFELFMAHEVRGRPISSRIDRLYIEGVKAWVKDYKTGHADPPQRPEPTPQGDIYAWQAMQAHPHLEVVTFEQEHVRFGHAPQPFEYTREAVAEIGEWLFDMVGMLDHAYAQGGELPANPGDACSKWGGCAVARDCPAKKWTRPATEITTGDEAIAEFQALIAEGASIDVRKKAIRGYLEREDLRVIQANGQEIGFAPNVPDPGTDWKSMALASGKDPAEFARKQPKNPSFGVRKAK